MDHNLGTMCMIGMPQTTSMTSCLLQSFRQCHTAVVATTTTIGGRRCIRIIRSNSRNSRRCRFITRGGQ